MTAKERVENELKDLSVKVYKLDRMLKADTRKFNKPEIRLLKKQLVVMVKYEKILKKRIKIWREI